MEQFFQLYRSLDRDEEEGAKGVRDRGARTATYALYATSRASINSSQRRYTCIHTPVTAVFTGSSPMHNIAQRVTTTCDCPTYMISCDLVPLLGAISGKITNNYKTISHQRLIIHGVTCHGA